MPDKPKRPELRQAKAEYKMLKKAAPTGDAEYDSFVQKREQKREKLAAGQKNRGNSEKMVSETAKYCGPAGCMANPTMSGDGANKAVTSGTQKTVRGGRSFQESGKGTMKTNLRKQKKADIQALAIASRANASEYDIKRGEAVKTRLGLQAASRERMNQQAYNKNKRGSSTL